MPQKESVSPLSERTDRNTQVIGRLRRGVNVAQSRAELNTIQRSLAQQYPEDRNAFGVEVRPLLEYVSGDFRQPLYLLFGAVTAVLLIACANVAGLLLARGFSRRHEFGGRVALGAKPSHIVRQVLIESTMLALCGGAIGIALAYVMLKTVLSLAPADLPRIAQVRIDGIILAFAFLVSLVTGVVFGVFPAWSASRSDSSGLWRGSRNQRRPWRPSVARNVCNRGDRDQSCAAGRLGVADRQLRRNDARSARLRCPSHPDDAIGNVWGRISAGKSAAFLSAVVSAPRGNPRRRVGEQRLSHSVQLRQHEPV
jgi:hypothetical protein